MRIVLDTNVFVSALISTKGKPRELLEMSVISNRFTIIISKEVIYELTKVLRRSKFNLAEENVAKAILDIMRSSEAIIMKSKFKVVREDSSDDAILNTALDGNADYIVSGDGHLLKLAEFKGIRIVSVADMLKVLE